MLIKTHISTITMHILPEKSFKITKRNWYIILLKLCLRYYKNLRRYIFLHIISQIYLEDELWKYTQQLTYFFTL